MIVHKPVSRSKTIRLRCMLAVAGRVLNGETRKLSDVDVSAQFPMLIMPGVKRPEHGASGLLTLSLSPPAQPMSETIRIPCHIVYTADIIVQLNLHTESLDDAQHKTLDDLLNR